MIRAEGLEGGAVLHLVLDRPPANILDARMIASIVASLDSHVTDDTKLIVFEGAGDHFCFGASVPEHQKDQAGDMLSSFHGMFRKLARLAIPTCAVVRGQCLGGGLELASWCTWIVATPEARLGQPEIKLAVFPPMASVILPWRVGGGAGLDLCVSGRSVRTEEALSMGLITAISEDPGGWWHKRYERNLAPTSASSLRFAERAVRGELERRMDTHLPTLEALYLDELMNTHDANEGIVAFIERRKPNFSND